jgi:hypothetical protein
MSDERLYRPVIKKGTHLASSKSTDGAKRGALLDNKTNKVVGQAEFVEVEEVSACEYNKYRYNEIREETELSDREEAELSEEAKAIASFLGEALAVVTIKLIEAATPHIKSWWTEAVVPSFKMKQRGIVGKIKAGKLIEKKKNNQIRTANVLGASGTAPGISAVFSKEIEEAYEKYRMNMSSEEAQRELIDIAILSTILAAKIRKLSDTCIRADGGIPEDYLEWQEVIEKLTAQKVTDSINLILENNISLIDEKSLVSLSSILGHSLISNGQYIPISNDGFKKALALNIV